MSQLSVKYEMTDNNGRKQHTWSSKDEKGGVHIWGRLSKLEGWPTEWIGGCESHSYSPPDYEPNSKPHNDPCWLLEAPCWHDGSSLMFTERVAGYLPHPEAEDADDMDERHHSMVESMVRGLHYSWFGERT